MNDSDLGLPLSYETWCTSLGYNRLLVDSGGSIVNIGEYGYFLVNSSSGIHGEDGYDGDDTDSNGNWYNEG